MKYDVKWRYGVTSRHDVLTSFDNFWARILTRRARRGRARQRSGVFIWHCYCKQSQIVFSSLRNSWCLLWQEYCQSIFIPCLLLPPSIAYHMAAVMLTDSCSYNVCEYSLELIPRNFLGLILVSSAIHPIPLAPLAILALRPLFPEQFLMEGVHTLQGKF